MTPIELKDVKRGDIFYQTIGLKEYKFEALEDSVDKGYITIAKQEYKQYMVNIRNEYGEESYLMVTEGLAHYNGKYYKR